jgi:hypothetical protein
VINSGHGVIGLLWQICPTFGGQNFNNPGITHAERQSKPPIPRLIKAMIPTSMTAYAQGAGA